ncbi:hypothetical protein CDL12_26917 [Handroanthus impetiginosus]|uniref:Uncharacterized protein n=1 Tax=Handroanthus impetiginosus TaxID=429701 RepID=A0A2G9G6M9_9LAMI|nr:hypothetical protein CDL12_26917 [Handroanthus impetiginosus]
MFSCDYLFFLFFSFFCRGDLIALPSLRKTLKNYSDFCNSFGFFLILFIYFADEVGVGEDDRRRALRRPR